MTIRIDYAWLAQMAEAGARHGHHKIEVDESRRVLEVWGPLGLGSLSVGEPITLASGKAMVVTSITPRDKTCTLGRVGAGYSPNNDVWGIEVHVSSYTETEVAERFDRIWPHVLASARKQQV